MQLTQDQIAHLTSRGFSRRSFGRILTLLTAGASLPLYHEASLAHAQLSSLGRALPPDAVKINANEYAEGPAQAALGALMTVAAQGNRYQYQETFEMLDAVTRLEGVGREGLVPYPGSSLGLHHGVIAFVSPGRGLVTVDPGYEAAARAAGVIGAEVTRIPLREDGSQDVKAMVAAARETGAGLIYLCNPNNPTGVTVPRKDVIYVLENKPADTVVLLDEAYIHLTDEPFGSDLVRQEKDVVVLRTFSKIYGMAGLRAGFAMGRPDLVSKMRQFSAGAMPATGMAAARASLEDEELVPKRRRKTAEIRGDLFTFLEKHGFRHTPSQSTKFMVEVGMPVDQFIRGMADKHIFVGRAWPAWSTWNRVSIGTAEEMERFKAAFLEVTKS